MKFTEVLNFITVKKLLLTLLDKEESPSVSPLDVSELGCEGAGGLDDEEILDICFSVAVSYF